MKTTHLWCNRENNSSRASNSHPTVRSILQLTPRLFYFFKEIPPLILSCRWMFIIMCVGMAVFTVAPCARFALDMLSIMLVQVCPFILARYVRCSGSPKIESRPTFILLQGKHVSKFFYFSYVLFLLQTLFVKPHVDRTHRSMHGKHTQITSTYIVPTMLINSG